MRRVRITIDVDVPTNGRLLHVALGTVAGRLPELINEAVSDMLFSQGLESPLGGWLPPRKMSVQLTTAQRPASL